MQKYGVIIGVIKMRKKGMSFPDCQRRHFISSWTAQEIMKKYERCGHSLDELEKMNSSEVEELFYPQDIRRHRKIPLPDFGDLIERLQASGKKINKTKIWDMYHDENPDGYQRSQLLNYCNQYMLERFGPDNLTMGVNRIPGERVFIDYCGDKAIVHIQEVSRQDTDQQKIHLFLTTCGYSSKLYGEASLDEKQARFNAGTAHALTYYGAVPRYLVPDNLRTGVTLNTKDEVIINASYQDLESYYETIVLPPPYYRPRGKSTVERYVQVIERKVVEELESQYWFRDLEEVNAVVKKIVETENNKIPKGYKQTHNELFEIYDKPAMRPLKDAEYLECDYDFIPAVPNNYHVFYDQHSYSVPYRYYGHSVIIKASQDTIFLCDSSNHLIAQHKRCYAETIRYITKEEHMPANHRFYKEVNEQDSDFYLKWAEEIGPNMKQLINTILKSSKHEEQMYRACNGIRYMCKEVAKGLCEEAAADCIIRKKCKYSEFREVLGDLLARRKNIAITAPLPEVEDVWGKDYYE